MFRSRSSSQLVHGLSSAVNQLIQEERPDQLDSNRKLVARRGKINLDYIFLYERALRLSLEHLKLFSGKSRAEATLDINLRLHYLSSRTRRRPEEAATHMAERIRG